MFESPTTITQIDVTYTATFVDQGREPQNLFGNLYLNNTLVTNGSVITYSLTDGTHTVCLVYDSIVCNRIDLMMQCEAGYAPQQGGAIITKIVIHGAGTNPISFSETNWCQEFKFSEYGNGGWINFAYNGTPCYFIKNQGWVAGYNAGGSMDEMRVSIRRNLDQLATLTQIEVTYEGAFLDEVREIANMFVKLYGNGVQVGYIDKPNLPDDNDGNTLTFGFDLATCSQIDIMLICEAGYVPQQGNGKITNVKISGKGENPFLYDAITKQTQLDTTFAALRDALQTDPDADVSTEIGAYRSAIEDAFGVTFSREPGSPQLAKDWGAISLHFAHQALQKTAKAFEEWVKNELDNPCMPIDPYALFRRIMGDMEIQNVAEVAVNFALTSGHLIKVYHRPKSIDYYVYTDNGQKIYAPTVLVDGTPQDPPAQWNPPDDKKENLPQYDSDIYLQGNLIDSGRQAIMTPNNLIHELGHAISNFTGFGFKLIGSIENALDAAQMPTSRVGMGPDYLRVQFYEHAAITEDLITHDAVFTPTVPPYSFDPLGYLLYDLMGNQYNTWNSNLYTSLYGNVARIDTNVQNPDAGTDYIETAADSFLNWVLNAFDNSTTGQAWIQFYADNIGMFLRNAAIWHIGMMQYYQSRNVIPNTSITPATINSGNFSVRLTPNGDIIGNSTSLLPPVGNNIGIFGWTDTSPIQNAPYWLLVPDNQNRLVWVAPGAANHNQADLTTSNKIDPELVSPVRPFNSDDLALLLGE